MSFSITLGLAFNLALIPSDKGSMETLWLATEVFHRVTGQVDLTGNWQRYLPALGFLAGGLLAGLVIQKWMLRYARSFAAKTTWRGDDILIDALGWLPVIWSICLGGYLAKMYGHLDFVPQGVAHKVILSVVMITGTLALARLVGQSIELWSGRVKGHVHSTSLFSNGARLLVCLLGLILLLQNLNIEITPIITALGLGGLAVALALEETLSNLFAGVQIIASRVVRTGDYVKLSSGYEGYVTDVKARSTTICSFPSNNRIIVPNSVLASSTVINCSLPERSLWVEIDVGVSYDSDLSHVERVTLEVAGEIVKSLEGTVTDHEPVFRYTSFGDSSINFNIRIFVREFQDQFIIRHAFIKKLHQRFGQENIEIPFPIRTVHMKQTA